jgi:hypothetical protein
MRRHIALFVITISVFGLGSGAVAQSVDPVDPTPSAVPGVLPQPESPSASTSTPADPTATVVTPPVTGWYDEMGNWYGPRRVKASKARRGVMPKPRATTALEAKVSDVKSSQPNRPVGADPELKAPEEEVAKVPPALPVAPQKKSLRERRRI